MSVSPHLMTRFTEAKEDFKLSVCRQVDQLFATFLEQIQLPSSSSSVVVSTCSSSNGTLTPVSVMTSIPGVQQQQLQQQHHLQPGHHLLASSNNFTAQTLGDIIAAGADSDLIALNALSLPVSSSSSSNQTITINHWSPALSQETPTALTMKPKVILPIATKTVATKSKPTASPAAVRGAIPEQQQQQQPQQQNYLQNQQQIQMSDQNSGYSLVPIMVTTTTNNNNSQVLSGTLQGGPQLVTLPVHSQSLPTYQLPLLQLPQQQQQQQEASHQLDESDQLLPDLPENWDSDTDCTCSECEEGDEADDDSSGGPGSSKRIKSEPKSSSSSSSSTKQIKTYPCKVPGCNLTFPRKHQLKDHRRTSHPSSGDLQNNSIKSFVCRHRNCGKLFQSPNHLRRHECIHTNVRPYRCKWTGCAFVAIQRSDAIRHVRVKHFNLPRTFKLQQEQGIEDQRDPLEYVEINR